MSKKTSFPWVGEARPMKPQAFVEAADRLGCDVAAVKAVWDVEAAGSGFFKDGTLKRRFEPHWLPGSSLTWRDSLKLSTSVRERQFLEAYADNPDAALRATSFGAPQIMGFNCRAAGFFDAEGMVLAMSEDEGAHLSAFLTLVESWGLAETLKSKNWLKFARKYNGNGQPGVYAARLKSAYARHDERFPTLKRGSTGVSVQLLQRKLGVSADGQFGPATEAALKSFQLKNGLASDGVAGPKTWSILYA